MPYKSLPFSSHAIIPQGRNTKGWSYVTTLQIIVNVRWTIAGSTSIVTLIQTVMLSERSPVLTRLIVTVPLLSLRGIITVLNSIIATSEEIQSVATC